MTKTVFITGTDTGVGKTLFTALFLNYLRQAGKNALAMKPFCSGSRSDIDLLQSIQKNALPDNSINPFFFEEPVAPLVSSQKRHRFISLEEVLMRIQEVEPHCDYLLIEGCGGLMVPLGPGYSVASLVDRLGCPVLIIARNQLGVINHTLLTLSVLKRLGVSHIEIILMNCEAKDYSAAMNLKTMRELIPEIEVLTVPFLGPKASTSSAIKRSSKKLKKTLALVERFVNFSNVLCETVDGLVPTATKKFVDQSGGNQLDSR